jgi:hypothetical protein
MVRLPSCTRAATRPAHNHTGKVSTDTDDLFLTPAAAAVFLGLRPATLASWRSRGRVAQDARPGPPFYYVANRLIRYRRYDLIAWAEANGPQQLNAANAPVSSATAPSSSLSSPIPSNRGVRRTRRAPSDGSRGC